MKEFKGRNWAIMLIVLAIIYWFVSLIEPTWKELRPQDKGISIVLFYAFYLVFNVMLHANADIQGKHMPKFGEEFMLKNSKYWIYNFSLIYFVAFLLKIVLVKVPEKVFLWCDKFLTIKY